MKVTAVIEDLPSQTHLTATMFASARSPDSDIAKAEKVDSPLNNITATYFRLRPGKHPRPILSRACRIRSPTFCTLTRFGGQWAKTPRSISILVPLADIHLTPSTQGAFKPAGDKAIIGAIAAIGALIVLVASINFVTLMTARAARRAVEVGVRKAAGARRSDLIVQFMGEALIYVVLAWVLATALAELFLPGFNALLQRRIAFDYIHDAGLAGAMLLSMLVVALLAGAYPALVLSAFRPSAVLKGGLVQTTGGGGVRQALVIVQFAVLIGLVLCAVTITRQTVYALNEGMRLDKDQVLFLAAEPCTDTLRDAMRALPGVRQAACTSAYALGMSEFASTVTIDGRRSQVDLAPVDFGFFDVYGVKPLAGRLFDQHRPADGYIAGSEINPPVVINETAVRKLGFPSAAAAIGHVVRWNFHVDLATPCCNEPVRPSQIIGVVPDFTFASMRTPIMPMMYVVGPKISYYSIALNLKLDGQRIPGDPARHRPALETDAA